MQQVERRPIAVTPVAGFSYLIQGAKLLPKPGIKRYVLIPLAINILLFSVAIGVATRHVGSMVMALEAYLPSWLDALGTVVWVIFAILMVLVVFFTFSIFANLIAAPFNAYLAARVEWMVTGQAPPSIDRSMAEEVAIAARESIKRLIYMGLAAIVVLIGTLLMTLTGVLAPFVPAVWFIFGAWLLAIEYSEYPMTNHNMMFRQQRQRLRERGVLSIGFGSWVSLGMMVPLMNLFVMPAAVAGATLAWVDHWQHPKHTHSQ